VPPEIASASANMIPSSMWKLDGPPSCFLELIPAI
jgi:hypothetical protein